MPFLRALDVLCHLLFTQPVCLVPVCVLECVLEAGRVGDPVNTSEFLRAS